MHMPIPAPANKSSRTTPSIETRPGTQGARFQLANELNNAVGLN
jgi:hypothetical protein